MRLLLDTAVLIYAMQSPERLSVRADVALRLPQNALELSAISLSEIAIKSAVGKLKISAESAREAAEGLDIRILPFTAEHAFRLFELPLHHRDPFDRQIIAQALVEKVSVVTPDDKFERYAGLKIIW
ncbi:MAG: type II toxin-antitoxin system VapC family toxin [Candidatus Sulfotelmatobacter sp.]